MSQHGEARGRRPRRRDRLIEDTRHDPYRDPGKVPDESVCPGCGLGVRSGRWQDVSVPFAARDRLCPACRRAQGPYPAGFVRLSGPYLRAHRTEIEGLLRNVERRERGEHPLQRIIAIEEQPDAALLVTTTGSHLGRALGDAVHRACGGSLALRYADAENLVRVAWER